jgi:uncharacterized protein
LYQSFEAHGKEYVFCGIVGGMRHHLAALPPFFLLAACGSDVPRALPPAPAEKQNMAVSVSCPEPASSAATVAPADESQSFEMTKAMIPMRDGVRLETAIFVPRDVSGPLPFLLDREPYGIPSDETFAHRPHASRFLADGYIVVWQNLRGRFGSEGEFVMDRPLRDRKNQKSTDEATDAYDTIEWLIANVPNNNGRVGMIGASYSAQMATTVQAEPHPALGAIVEEASPADQFLGDDFHHNGAFRLAYAFEYVALLETGKTNTMFAFDRGDMFDFYLALGPLGNADKRHFHGKMPTWNDFTQHPDYDAFWKIRSFDAQLPSKATVPILNVAGWWDQEDFYGPLRIYAHLEKNDSEKKNHFVAGPWNHGGWHTKGDKLGQIEFGSATGHDYAEKIKAPFLAYHLHGKGKGDIPEATVFETGSNQWRTFDAWPPTSGVRNAKLYLHPGRKLAFDPPKEAGQQAADSYVSDPNNPVPHQPRPIPGLFTSSDWSIWQARDQRFSADRNDVLTYSTSPLEEDITIAGNVFVELFASTSGTDSDWIVKLIDVFPEGPPPPRPPGNEFGPAPDGTPPDLRGFQLMIDGDVLRGRFRESFEKPAPIKANAMAKYTIPLHSHAHVFRKGHRIMLHVQSSWFPVIDRNPQRFVKNIFQATEADFITTTQRISRAKEAPSAIVLPIVGK